MRFSLKKISPIELVFSFPLKPLCETLPSLLHGSSCGEVLYCVSLYHNVPLRIFLTDG